MTENHTTPSPSTLTQTIKCHTCAHVHVSSAKDPCKSCIAEGWGYYRSYPKYRPKGVYRETKR